MKTLFLIQIHSSESLRLSSNASSEVHACLEHVAPATSKLKTLNILARNPIPHASISAICEANPDIRSIQIDCWRHSTDPSWTSVDVIEKCLSAFRAGRILIILAFGSETRIATSRKN